MRSKRRQRIINLMCVILLAFLFQAGRLFYIQLIKGPEFAKGAVIQRSLRYVYASGRGQILDRNGYSLLDTLWEPVLVSFEPMIDEGVRQVLKTGEQTKTQGPAHVVSDPALINYLKDQDIFVEVEQEVRYGSELLAPHVIGYVQKEEILRQQPTYRELFFTAKSGLELYFNEYLASSRPSTLAAIVDAQGRTIDGLGFRDWRDDNLLNPHNVVTTLDSSIQDTVEKIGRSSLSMGAIIVAEAKTGDILALASFPDYSPREMYNGMSSAQFTTLKNDSRKPFVNRTLQAFAPGSVFKIILAAAAIEHGLERHSYQCSGHIEVGDRFLSCYNHFAHGQLDSVKDALALSCNGYFIELGQLLGRKTILDYASRFGLGKTVGVPLYGESPGNIPSIDELPYLGDLANASIGQGLVETTPLQLARMMTIIANDGRNINLRLVNRITDRNGSTVRHYPVKSGSKVISSVTASKLKDMLAEVTAVGTARDAASSDYFTAGKSGTAETNSGDRSSYRWFAGFTQPEDPLVVVVFAEEMGEKTPAAIFKEVIETVLPLRK